MAGKDLVVVRRVGWEEDEEGNPTGNQVVQELFSTRLQEGDVVEITQGEKEVPVTSMSVGETEESGEPVEAPTEVLETVTIYAEGDPEAPKGKSGQAKPKAAAASKEK